MHINLVDFFLVFTALIVLGISILLFARKNKYVTQITFASFLFLIALSAIFNYVYQSDTFNALLVLQGIKYTWAPLLYLYCITFINNTPRLSIKQYLHFLPAVMISITLFIIGVVYQGVEETWFLSLSWGVYWFSAIDVFLNCQFAIYLGLTIDSLRRYKFWLEDNYSNIEVLGLLWLNRFVFGIFIMFMTHFLLYGLDINWFSEQVPSLVDKGFYLAGLAMLTWAGLYCLLNPRVFNCQMNFIPETSPLNKQKSFVNQSDRANDKISNVDKTDLPETDLTSEELIRLNTLMCDKKPYLDANMGLTDLAEKTGLTQKKLSALLNQSLNESFYTYVNNFRIEEVKLRLSDIKNRHAKLEVIAIESGFRSTSTFNRLFKQHTQMTPQQYREQQLKTSELTD